MTVPRKDKKREARREAKAEKAAVLEKVEPTQAFTEPYAFYSSYLFGYILTLILSDLAEY